MRRVVFVTSFFLGLFLLMNCAGDGDGEYGGQKDSGAGAAAPEWRIPCTEVKDCDDGDPCTVDDCYEGFCHPQSNPIDEDLDGYVSHICGGPDCDDQNGTIHPGTVEASYGEAVCSDGVDNDCNGRVDEEDAGCFHCGSAEDCDDGNPCTHQDCVGGRCAYTDRPGPCDDGNPCTVNDACFGGFCTGDPPDADGDGHIDAACGGDDCDDSLAGVYPGAREGPPSDPSCGDGADNDCDGGTDGEELACQGENLVIELAAEEELAPTETDLEIAFTVGTFHDVEVIRISYTGDVEAVYVPTEGRVRAERMVLAVDPVAAGIQLPLGTLTVELESFRVALEDPEDLILDPEGFFSAGIRLRVDTIATVRLNALKIIEDYPMGLLSNGMSVSGHWAPRGDTDGDGREEFDFLVAGPVTYAFPTMDVPLLGQVAAAISGNVQLGFRGEAL